MLYLVFDIGGTKTRIAVSKDGKTLNKVKIIPTPKKFSDGIKAIESSALEISQGKKIKAICGGVAGPLNHEKSFLVGGPNISGWVKKPLKKTLEKIFRAPVFLENDAALAGLGEARFGAGKNKKIVAYITVSTGVGGSKIMNSKIEANFLGFEPGHQIIDAGGCLCKKCRGGYLLNHISGSAIKKHYGKNPKEISYKKIKNNLAKWLAIGLNNSIVHWSPEIIVLGGSIMNIIPLDRVRTHLKNILKIFPKMPRIKKAALGDLGGLYGALVFLKRR